MESLQKCYIDMSERRNRNELAPAPARKLDIPRPSTPQSKHLLNVLKNVFKHCNSEQNQGRIILYM